MQLEAGHKLKPFYPQLRVDSTVSPSLLGAWVAMDGYASGFRDYGPSGRHAAWNGTWLPTMGAGNYGPAWPFDGNASHYAKVPSITLGTEGTVAAVVLTPTSVSGVPSICGNSTSTSGSILRVAFNFAVSIRVDIGTVTFTSNALAAAVKGTWATIILRWNASSQDIWINGVLDTSSSTANGFTPPGSDFFTIGTGPNAAAWTQGIDSVFLSSTRWTDAQARQWSADPWGVLRPSPTFPLAFAASAPSPAIFHGLSLLGVGI